MIVVEVERAKHLREKLTSDERGAIVKTLATTTWSIDEIRRRGEAVKRADTYGSIGMQWWHNAERTYSESEAEAMALQIIERRRRQFQQNAGWNPDRKKLAEAGLIETTTYYQGLIDAEMQLIIDKLSERIRSARATIKRMDKGQKTALRAILENKVAAMQTEEESRLFSVLNKVDSFWATKDSISDLSEDELWEQILPYFAPWCYREVETMVEV
jgi:hypothetical protein